MAKILSPNRQYTGVSASVSFANGIGETDDRNLIDWFKAHGYTVETEKKQKVPDTSPEKLENAGGKDA